MNVGDLQKRLDAVQAKFEELEASKTDAIAEQYRLQGEGRLLENLIIEAQAAESAKKEAPSGATATTDK